MAEQVTISASSILQDLQQVANLVTQVNQGLALMKVGLSEATGRTKAVRQAFGDLHRKSNQINTFLREMQVGNIKPTSAANLPKYVQRFSLAVHNLESVLRGYTGATTQQIKVGSGAAKTGEKSTSRTVSPFADRIAKDAAVIGTTDVLKTLAQKAVRRANLAAERLPQQQGSLTNIPAIRTIGAFETAAKNQLAARQDEVKATNKYTQAIVAQRKVVREQLRDMRNLLPEQRTALKTLFKAFSRAEEVFSAVSPGNFGALRQAALTLDTLQKAAANTHRLLNVRDKVLGARTLVGRTGAVEAVPYPGAQLRILRANIEPGIQRLTTGILKNLAPALLALSSRDPQPHPRLITKANFAEPHPEVQRYLEQTGYLWGKTVHGPLPRDPAVRQYTQIVRQPRIVDVAAAQGYTGHLAPQEGVVGYRLQSPASLPKKIVAGTTIYGEGFTRLPTAQEIDQGTSGILPKPGERQPRRRIPGTVIEGRAFDYAGPLSQQVQAAIKANIAQYGPKASYDLLTSGIDRLLQTSALVPGVVNPKTGGMYYGQGFWGPPRKDLTQLPMPTPSYLPKQALETLVNQAIIQETAGRKITPDALHGKITESQLARMQGVVGAITYDPKSAAPSLTAQLKSLITSDMTSQQLQAAIRGEFGVTGIRKKLSELTGMSQRAAGGFLRDPSAKLSSYLPKGFKGFLSDESGAFDPVKLGNLLGRSWLGTRSLWQDTRGSIGWSGDQPGTRFNQGSAGPVTSDVTKAWLTSPHHTSRSELALQAEAAQHKSLAQLWAARRADLVEQSKPVLQALRAAAGGKGGPQAIHAATLAVENLDKEYQNQVTQVKQQAEQLRAQLTRGQKGQLTKDIKALETRAPGALVQLQNRIAAYSVPATLPSQKHIPRMLSPERLYAQQVDQLRQFEALAAAQKKFDLRAKITNRLTTMIDRGTYQSPQAFRAEKAAIHRQLNASGMQVSQLPYSGQASATPSNASTPLVPVHPPEAPRNAPLPPEFVGQWKALVRDYVIARDSLVGGDTKQFKQLEALLQAARKSPSQATFAAARAALARIDPWAPSTWAPPASNPSPAGGGGGGSNRQPPVPPVPPAAAAGAPPPRRPSDIELLRQYAAARRADRYNTRVERARQWDAAGRPPTGGGGGGGQPRGPGGIPAQAPWAGMLGYLGLHMLIGGFYKLTAAISGSIEKAADYQIALAQIQTISSYASEAGIDRLSASLTVLGKKWAIGPMETASALYYTISNQMHALQGFNVDIPGSGQNFQKATDFLEDAALFGRAAVTPLNDSAEILSSVINSYKLGAGAAQQMGAELFKMIELGRVLGTQVKANLGRVLPLSYELGIDPSEVFAGIAHQTIMGMKPEESLTLLGNTMMKLLRPTKELQEELNRLGVMSTSLALRARGFQGFLEHVTDHSGVAAESVGELFNRVRAVRGVLTFVGGQAEKYKQIHERVSNITLEDLQKAAGKIGAVPGLTYKEIKAEFDIFWTAELGPKMLDMYNWIMKLVGPSNAAVAGTVVGGAAIGLVTSAAALRLSQAIAGLATFAGRLTLGEKAAPWVAAHKTALNLSTTAIIAAIVAGYQIVKNYQWTSASEAEIQKRRQAEEPQRQLDRTFALEQATTTSRARLAQIKSLAQVIDETFGILGRAYNKDKADVTEWASATEAVFARNIQSRISMIQSLVSQLQTLASQAITNQVNLRNEMANARNLVGDTIFEESIKNIEGPGKGQALMRRAQQYMSAAQRTADEARKREMASRAADLAAQGYREGGSEQDLNSILNQRLALLSQLASEQERIRKEAEAALEINKQALVDFEHGFAELQRYPQYDPEITDTAQYQKRVEKRQEIAAKMQEALDRIITVDVDDALMKVQMRKALTEIKAPFADPVTGQLNTLQDALTNFGVEVYKRLTTLTQQVQAETTKIADLLDATRGTEEKLISRDPYEQLPRYAKAFDERLAATQDLARQGPDFAATQEAYKEAEKEIDRYLGALWTAAHQKATGRTKLPTIPVTESEFKSLFPQEDYDTQYRAYLKAGGSPYSRDIYPTEDLIGRRPPWVFEPEAWREYTKRPPRTQYEYDRRKLADIPAPAARDMAAALDIISRIRAGIEKGEPETLAKAIDDLQATFPKKSEMEQGWFSPLKEVMPALDNALKQLAIAAKTAAATKVDLEQRGLLYQNFDQNLQKTNTLLQEIRDAIKRTVPDQVPEKLEVETKRREQEMRDLINKQTVLPDFSPVQFASQNVSTSFDIVTLAAIHAAQALETLTTTEHPIYQPQQSLDPGPFFVSQPRPQIRPHDPQLLKPATPQNLDSPYHFTSAAVALSNFSTATVGATQAISDYTTNQKQATLNQQFGAYSTTLLNPSPLETYTVSWKYAPEARGASLLPDAGYGDPQYPDVNLQPIIDSVSQGLFVLFQPATTEVANFASATAYAASMLASIQAPTASRGGQFFATGGDVVSAHLTPGEFVLNPRATQQWYPTIKAMNRFDQPRFAQGGDVTNVGDVIVNVNGAAAQNVNGRQLAQAVRRALHQKVARL